MRSLADEVRFLLAAAPVQYVFELEAYVAGGPGRRTLVPGVKAPFMGGRAQPAKVQIDDCAVREIQIEHDSMDGGRLLTLMVDHGALVELEPLMTESRPWGVDMVMCVAPSNGPFVELEVLHHEGRISRIRISFASVRGRFAAVTLPTGLTTVADELRAVLDVLAPTAPIVADDVARWLASRGISLLPHDPNGSPWWSSSSGLGTRFAALANSAVNGIQFSDDSRGWGCDVVLCTSCGTLAEIEQVVGPVTEPVPIFDNFGPYDTHATKLAIGGLEIDVRVKHARGRVATITVHFPPGPREQPDEPRPPPGPPPTEPYQPSRADVVVLAVQILETGRVVHHELERSFLLGSSPDSDIVVPWHSPSLPEIWLRCTIVRGHVQVVEACGFSLDGRHLDLVYPTFLVAGSRLTAGVQLEILVLRLPS